VLRRIEVEPDHVRGLRLEVGIGRAHLFNICSRRC
jgi:hypothetical protein